MVLKGETIDRAPARAALLEWFQSDEVRDLGPITIAMIRDTWTRSTAVGIRTASQYFIEKLLPELLDEGTVAQYTYGVKGAALKDLKRHNSRLYYTPPAELAPAALAALVAKLEQLVDLSRDTEIVRAEIDVQEQDYKRLELRPMAEQQAIMRELNKSKLQLGQDDEDTKIERLSRELALVKEIYEVRAVALLDLQQLNSRGPMSATAIDAQFPTNFAIAVKWHEKRSEVNVAAPVVNIEELEGDRMRVATDIVATPARREEKLGVTNNIPDVVAAQPTVQSAASRDAIENMEGPVAGSSRTAAKSRLDRGKMVQTKISFKVKERPAAPVQPEVIEISDSD